MSAGMAVALLRGINVGGKNMLPMTALAEIFAASGCTDVKTYIQSGNVVFRHLSNKDVAARVSAGIAKQFQLKVPVIVRTADEMATTVERYPFLSLDPRRKLDEACLHVIFLEDEPSSDLIAGLDVARSAPDEFVVIGREIYLHLPNGAAKTKLTNAYFDAKLKTVGTQRNWRTVLTLARMAGVS